MSNIDQYIILLFSIANIHVQHVQDGNILSNICDLVVMKLFVMVIQTFKDLFP